MACVVVTKTALSVRVDALMDAGENSTPSAPKIGLENRAKLEARLRSVEAESDFTVSDALPCDLISRSVSSSAPLHLPISHTEKGGVNCTGRSTNCLQRNIKTFMHGRHRAYMG